jgi:hypothetical protein
LVEKVYKRIIEIDRDFANDVSNTALQNVRRRFEKEIKDLSEYTNGIVSESSNLSKSIENSRKESVSNAEQIEKVLKQVQNEWEEFRSKYKDLFAKGEVVRQSQNFLSISQLYTQRANVWRGIIVAIVIVLLVVSIIFLKSEFNFTYSKAYQAAHKIGKEYFSFLFFTKFGGLILLKAFILSILIYILRFGVRNYNALMHNATINAHKHNSLDAALRLIEGITSSDLQNEILAKAGKEIFNQHSTGYLEKENAVSNLSIAEKVTDIVSKRK